VLTTISNVIAIAAGAFHTVALTADKTVWTWGTNSFGELGRTGDTTVPGQISPSVLSNVVAIAGGAGFSLAVTGDGYIHAWGDGTAGELGVSGINSTNIPIRVPGISNVVLVSATSADPGDYEASAERHVVAMTLDPVDGTGQTTNRYWGWGSNFSGAVGNGTNGYGVYQTAPAQVQFCTRCQRCIQLGTGGGSSGVFTAQCNGTLYLYFNDDQTQMSNDGSGSFAASVDGFGQFTVMGNNASGTFVGMVTNGQVCSFSATGTCYYVRSDPTTAANPNGVGPNGLWNCSNSNVVNNAYTVCPMWQCFSLVGKIQ
jgi:alpha-tubulin suppressor-like RCC1 family protein